MAFEYLAYQDLLNHRSFRDDPFDMTPSEFRKLYRISPDMADYVVELLDNKIKSDNVTALSSEDQVLATLRFYATGCYQKPNGVIMSQSSINSCVHRVTDAFNSSLFFTKVRFPMTQIERQNAKNKFASAPYPFVEDTIGAIGCTDVPILAPKAHQWSYVNENGYHSIKVQMICDPNLKILNVNARFPGSQEVPYIWESSAARRIMERSYEKAKHLLLIGNSEYPLEPWLMTPLPYQPVGSPKFRYNEALCKALNPIERLFIILKGTWRCLAQQWALLNDPGFAGRVVNACATLHNISLGEQTFELDGVNLVTSTNNYFVSPISDNFYLINYCGPSYEAKHNQERIIANFT
ncbi:putative nuclease HARBI1 isoform X2 [Eurosta solidaginis]|uniref:putative nuclease HARBI1 isoform X2 n=1 Tax=Eurosta solidaginis TaxID=178769 RepID=UPI003530E70E